MLRTIAIIFLATLTVGYKRVNADPMVPCFFIFGDSLFDVGNNNNLKTKARVNYPPYGIDYLGHVATGRFSNGRNYVDILTEKLGFQGYIEPHTTAKGKELLKGVNYASGACGIRPETGQHLGVCVNLGQQIEQHKSVVNKLKGMVNGSVNDHLGKCLYAINIGSNDYLNNYFIPDDYPGSRKYTYPQYADELVNQYSKYIKVLYENGARKIAVFGLGFLGCSLAEIQKLHPRTSCVNSMNIAGAFFNKKLKSLVDQLTRSLPGLKITYINSQAIQTGTIQGNKSFTEKDKPCCTLREDFQCKEKTKPCANRNNYVFFDGFHPTEAVNRITAERAFKAATPFDVHPYDISRLVKA